MEADHDRCWLVTSALICFVGMPQITFYNRPQRKCTTMIKHRNPNGSRQAVVGLVPSVRK
jgi:hypothetical protein